MITQRVTQAADGTVLLSLAADQASATELIEMYDRLGQRGDVRSDGKVIELPPAPVFDPE